MAIVAVVMTGLITPIVTTIYRPGRRFVPHKRRTTLMSKPDAELRVLVCVHSPRNVPTIINLLKVSHPTKRSPMCVYVLHLVELTGRASAMLIVHNTRKSGRPALNRTQAQSGRIINAFENFEQHATCVSVQHLTAISPYSCSVGILVDRGLNGSTRLAANQVSHHIAVLFFGGPDDREALAYAWRMSEHPGITLTIMRFIPGEDVAQP